MNHDNFPKSAGNDTDPIDDQFKIKESNDKHIAQDFNSNPQTAEQGSQVKPETGTEKKTAAVDKTDGEKDLDADDRSRQTEEDEQDSDGSANAFSRTEPVVPPRKTGKSEPPY